ncbi:MAG: DUF1622 domain-containing protein [Chloroflexota bacterium]|nr:DUF1622 domain-containing protein [Chloroflexota bacterium]
MGFSDLIDGVGKTIDVGGVAVILIGALLATLGFARNVVARVPGSTAYRTYRQSLGRSILLGLELLVAADIIRTVAVSPSLLNVGVLAVIVLVRTFLSFSLEVELEGRWPWQRGSAVPSATNSGL